MFFSHKLLPQTIGQPANRELAGRAQYLRLSAKQCPIRRGPRGFAATSRRRSAKGLPARSLLLVLLSSWDRRSARVFPAQGREEEKVHLAQPATSPVRQKSRSS